MNNKRIFLIFILLVILGVGLISIRYFNHDTEYLTFVGKEEGYHESISFNNSFKFDKSLGEYVEYKVENIGNGDILVNINDGEDRNVKVGEDIIVIYELVKDSEILYFKAFSSNDRVRINYYIDQIQ